MKQWVTLACAVSVLVCSGCANQNVWVRDATDAKQAERDFNDCKYDSNKSSFVPFGNGTSPISAGIQEGFQSANLMNQCMRAKGYYLVNKGELERKQAEGRHLIEKLTQAMKSKEYASALDISDELISKFPSDCNRYYERGTVKYVMGKFNESVVDYNKAISLGCKDTKLFVEKAQAFVEMGEADIAIQSINQALSIRNEAPFYNIRAYALNKKGEYDKAIEDCNTSIALDSSKANPFKNRGLAYLGKGEQDKALEQFNKAIMIDPTYPYALDGRGDVYAKMGALEKARLDYQKACEFGLKDSCKKVK